MRHPFQRLSPRAARGAFIPLLVITLLVMAILNVVSAPLTTPAAPMGIISYELAGTAAKAQSILDSWDSLTQLHAAFALGFDYVFMLAYSTAIALGCVMAASVLGSRGWFAGGHRGDAGMGAVAGGWLRRRGELRPDRHAVRGCCRAHAPGSLLVRGAQIWAGIPGFGVCFLRRSGAVIHPPGVALPDFNTTPSYGVALRSCQRQGLGGCSI